MEKIIIEGKLYNSASEYLVIVQDDGKAVEIDDTLLRSPLICRKVKLSVELLEE